MAATRPRTLMRVRARRRTSYLALASLLVLLVAPGAAQRRPLNATLAILRGDSPVASGVENYLQVPQVFTVRLESGLPEWVRRQRRVPASTPFPCDTRGGRSAQRPSSVHRLRPGDIDVVAAMGDSLVAGNGALDEFALGAIIEYRGVSWCAGGDGTWREAVTLPNLLREYNPALRGYSVGRGEFLAPSAGLNVAFPVSADADALQQARTLVRRMRAYPGVDYQRDWKVVTVFFGANDLCSAQCYNPARAAAPHHIRRLRDALDYLHQHMPRAFVNLIPALDASVSVRVKRTFMCRMMHLFFCQCAHFGRARDKIGAISQLAQAYQRAEEELVASGRYDTRDDFTVVLQPFFKAFNTPADPVQRRKEAIDISFLTHDCFHFSQKGHALGANMLWNNMLEPVGNKSERGLRHVFEDFRCPTEDAPFIFTANNSRTFQRTGRQW
ncbi:phospholipase B1, membrane-associated-like [Schistocerca nitens]|uniref:phospholipase B1, membrane-associated-like n=1 Tax=Schistocerca nitens TaxID=7011 RepID=UPI002119B01F|nr:phospholipase B1, membrane-associated-like [Schistocerca nitens]